MGRKGPKQHLKRLAAPETYPIGRKSKKFIMRPKSSGHAMHESLPLGVLLRDVLKMVKNQKELKFLVSNNLIEVDGRPIRNHKFAVGSMDIIHIKKLDEKYRLIPTARRRRLFLKPFESEENWKLCKIMGKSNVKNNRIQFHLHDGRNIVIPLDEADQTDQFNDPKYLAAKPGGTFKITVPSQEILDYYPLEEGATILVDKGVNRGAYGKLMEIEKNIGRRKSIAVIISEDQPMRTALENIFVIGKESAEIELDTEAE